MKKCPQCKELIRVNYTFCPNCGKEFQDAKSNSKQSLSTKNNIKATPSYYGFLISVGILFVIVTGIVVMMQYSSSQYRKKVISTIQSNSLNSKLIPVVSKDTDLYQVASYFECSCGDCDDHELATCECPTAKSQREFIQKHLDEGKSVEEARMLVNEIFGSAKSQYSDWFKNEMKNDLKKLLKQ